MAATTTTTIAGLIQPIIREAELWLQSASLFYPGQGKAQQWIMWEDVTNTGGIAATFNEFTALEAGDTTEGQQYVNTSALTSAGTTVTATEKQINIPLTDLSKKAHKYGEAALIAKAGEAIGLAMAKKFDADVFAAFSNLGTSQNTTNTYLALEDFLTSINALQTNGAPEPYAMVLHPFGWLKFITDSNSTGLIKASESGPVGQAIWESYFAQRVMGVYCFQHSSVPKSGNDYVGAMFSNRAIGAVLAKGLEVEVQRDGLGRQDYLIGVMTYGVAKVSDTAGIQVLHKHS